MSISRTALYETIDEISQMHPFDLDVAKAVIASLIEVGANINEPVKVSNGISSTVTYPLHAALKSSYLSKEFIAYLVQDLKADVNVPESNGRTPLHIAAEKHNEIATKILLDAGAQVNAQDNSGNTPLHVAIAHSYGSLEEITGTITTLITNSKGEAIDVDVKNNQGYTPILLAYYYSAAVSSAMPPVIEILSRLKADLTARTKRNETILHLAAGSDDATLMDLACSLVKEGGLSLDEKDKEGYTPLMLAATVKNEGVFMSLLCAYSAKSKDAFSQAIEESGAQMLLDISKVGGRCFFQLQMVLEEIARIDKRKPGFGKAMLENARDSYGNSCLHLQTRWFSGGHVFKTLDLLLKYFKMFGADVNLQNKDGNTPLLAYVMRLSRFLDDHDEKIVKMLLENGARTDIAGNLFDFGAKCTAYEFAKMKREQIPQIFALLADPKDLEQVVLAKEYLKEVNQLLKAEEKEKLLKKIDQLLTVLEKVSAPQNDLSKMLNEVNLPFMDCYHERSVALLTRAAELTDDARYAVGMYSNLLLRFLNRGEKSQAAYAGEQVLDSYYKMTAMHKPNSDISHGLYMRALTLSQAGFKSLSVSFIEAAYECGDTKDRTQILRNLLDNRLLLRLVMNVHYDRINVNALCYDEMENDGGKPLFYYVIHSDCKDTVMIKYFLLLGAMVPSQLLNEEEKAYVARCESELEIKFYDCVESGLLCKDDDLLGFPKEVLARALSRRRAELVDLVNDPDNRPIADIITDHNKNTVSQAVKQTIADSISTFEKNSKNAFYTSPEAKSRLIDIIAAFADGPQKPAVPPTPAPSGGGAADPDLLDLTKYYGKETVQHKILTMLSDFIFDKSGSESGNAEIIKCTSMMRQGTLTSTDMSNAEKYFNNNFGTFEAILDLPPRFKNDRVTITPIADEVAGRHHCRILINGQSCFMGKQIVARLSHLYEEELLANQMRDNLASLGYESQLEYKNEYKSEYRTESKPEIKGTPVDKPTVASTSMAAAVVTAPNPTPASASKEPPVEAFLRTAYSLRNVINSLKSALLNPESLVTSRYTKEFSDFHDRFEAISEEVRRGERSMRQVLISDRCELCSSLTAKLNWVLVKDLKNPMALKTPQEHVQHALNSLNVYCAAMEKECPDAGKKIQMETTVHEEKEEKRQPAAVVSIATGLQTQSVFAVKPATAICAESGDKKEDKGKEISITLLGA